MKTSFYTFSGTGTSLAVSQTIADRLDDATITLIPKALAESKDAVITTEASAVGFVFPNYFGGVPQIVLEFGQLQQALASKGKKLDYGKSIIGFSNYIVG